MGRLTRRGILCVRLVFSLEATCTKNLRYFLLFSSWFSYLLYNSVAFLQNRKILLYKGVERLDSFFCKIGSSDKQIGLLSCRALCWIDFKGFLKPNWFYTIKHTHARALMLLALSIFVNLNFRLAI
jgi:hypothetical protein